MVGLRVGVRRGGGRGVEVKWECLSGNLIHGECVAPFDELGEVVDSVGIGEAG